MSPPPLEAPDEETAERRLPTDGPCGSLDTNKADFFSAESEEVARDGYVAFLKLQQALRDKQAVPLECDLYPADKQDCRTLILALATPSISEVERCDAGLEEDCYKVSADDREIRILLSASSATRIPPGRVLRTRLESMIIIADQRID